MTRDQLDLIPDDLLRGRRVNELIDWLYARGLRMTLLELDTERRRRRTTTDTTGRPRD